MISRLWNCGRVRWSRHAILPGALLLTALLWTACSKSGGGGGDEFSRLMNTGRNYYEQGQADKALPLFEQAVKLQPSRPDALLNLANACLLANQPARARQLAEEALSYDRNLAAAYYVIGCADIRERKFEDAVKALFAARDLDPTVGATHFQLGTAQAEMANYDDAAASLQEAVKLEPEHRMAHFSLGQALIRAGRQDEGLKSIERHKDILAKSTAAPATPATFERCKHTAARAPEKIELPDAEGIRVTFADATAAAFGADASKFNGPLAVLDFNRDDRNSLLAAEGTNAFRILANNGGKFAPFGEPLPLRADARFVQAITGDLNNDRYEDVLALGEAASQAFRFITNAAGRDWTRASGLTGVVGRAGVFVDFDITGKLDLMVVTPDGNGLRLLRNLGTMYFKDVTATSGVPAQVSGARQIVVDDWNNDDLMDVFVSREKEPPLYLQKQRGGPLVPTPLPAGRLEGTALAIGDVNGDSRSDLLVGDATHVDLLMGGPNKFARLPLAQPGLEFLRLVDFDNDGWLDVLAVGEGAQLWRNLGEGNFTNVTARVGLDKLPAGRITSLALADFDQDGDTDFIFSVQGQGVKLLRNDGGNANHQLKLRLIGNRSNASGLGVRLQIASDSFRAHRTVQSLPIEIGVGKRTRLDSLTARWFDFPFNVVDVQPDPKDVREIPEPTIPTGSCPYVYAWDGERFRFVTDILGSAPMGLRVTDTIFADADPREFVWLGDEKQFPPRDGRHVVQITEELREVLYLDEAKLVVVDHPAGTEVHTTDKFRPGRPFPRGEIWTLENRVPLQQATRLDGSDCTELLAATDGRQVSPARLRVPQLRGLAEPHGVVLDFGPLAVERPLVLALTGWLRFGGGMANVGASHDPELPFPFPRLEVESAAGQWQPVDVVAGAPAGKTKSILIDLAGKLPPGSRRLRLSTEFEIHWDRIALFERRAGNDTRFTLFEPDRADLHWRGFSHFAELPWTSPQTPVYERVFQTPYWAITPVGWCTRYGGVNELIARDDNALALLNGGDELTLEFRAERFPAKPPGAERGFFLYTVGWDKDSDVHVELGWKVEPLPWHGMDDQLYGRQPRPAFPGDDLMRRYTTRWVAQHTLRRPEAKTN